QMSKSPSARSGSKKRSSQECMEVDDDEKSREKSLLAPPSVKKAKVELMSGGEEDAQDNDSVKTATNDFGSDDEDDKDSVNKDKDEFASGDDKDVKVAAKEVVEEIVLSDVEEDPAVTAKKRKKADQARRAFTKMWINEEPYVNVERPCPSKTDREHFCWYDLTEEWSEQTRRLPIPVDNVDWTFNYGNNDFAKLPFAETGRSTRGGTSTRPRDRLIAEAMLSFSNGVRSLEHLEAGIGTWWKPFKAKSLAKLFAGQSEEVCQSYLDTISAIAALALRAKHLVTKPLPLLMFDGHVKSVTMSQEQAAVLLAYAFFCTVLPRPGDDWNHFSFHLFHTRDEQVMVEKMKFMLYYFKTVIEEMPRGTITFSRQTWDSLKDEEAGYDTWADPLSEMLVMSEGLIEEMEGCLQVDFANCYIGGGVMNHGAVQEEIRFLCCPEMLVSLFLFDRMDVNEAILIQGAQQFSAYLGYANSLKHKPMGLNRNEPRDIYGRARSYLIAIDAYCFQNRQSQYQMKFITREIKKAYTGFQLVGDHAAVRPIATGNWGCGVFNGDKELKSLIQLIAASKAGRPMIYITFKDEKFAQELEEMHDVLTSHKVTNGKLFDLLTQYKDSRKPGQQVFDFAKKALVDGF
ncbi:hypothetical protein PENTCL1PPCAC_19025, partial [Pristionchus entomophagus]